MYLNQKTGEVMNEHPCDEHFRQLVIKERKKRGTKLSKFGDFQPVGIQPVGHQGKAIPLQIQHPKKDIDPLVKM